MTTPSMEIATRDSLSPAVVTWLEKMRINATMNGDEDSIFGAQDSIAERILEAATEDEVFAAADAGTLSTKEFLDTPFLLHPDFEVRVSTQRNDEGGITGTGFYLLIKVTDLARGKERVLNTGAQTLMSVIWRLSELGVLTDSKKYPDGYPMILAGKASPNGTVIVPKPFRAYKSNAKARK